MNRIASAACIALLLTPACDKGDAAPTGQADAAPTGQADAAPTGEADAAPTGQADPAPTGKADPAPTGQADPAPTGAIASAGPRYPGEPGYDCGRLLTRAEIQSVCSTELQEVIIDTNETRSEHTRCSRRWRSPSERRTVSMLIGEYEKHPERPETAKDVEGLGDTAYVWPEERAPQIFWYTARVHKDKWLIDVRSIVTDSGTPLCDLDQLSKLAAKVVDRLEQTD